MTKKKTRQSKPRQLRLVNRSPIGLSDEQQKELREQYRPMGQLSDSRVSITDIVALRRTTLARFLYIYIEALCHDARLENGKRKGQTAALRRQVLSQIEQLCGREFSPEDIIRQLSKFSPVPTFAADAIRRDFLRISIN
jgi:hypothetical protein